MITKVIFYSIKNWNCGLILMYGLIKLLMTVYFKKQ